MKTELGVRIGPGMTSLLMILVTLLMASLAILAMAGAKSDGALSRRNLETTQDYYAAAARVQRALFEIDRQLADARAAAAGDADAYLLRVREIPDAYAAGQDKIRSYVSPQDIVDVYEAEGSPGGGVTLRLAAPMRNDRQLEATLEVPRALTGRRYTMTSHKVVDTAPWDEDAPLDLFCLQ